MIVHDIVWWCQIDSLQLFGLITNLYLEEPPTAIVTSTATSLFDLFWSGLSRVIVDTQFLASDNVSPVALIIELLLIKADWSNLRRNEDDSRGTTGLLIDVVSDQIRGA